MQSIKQLQNDRGVKSLDSLNASEQDLLAVALGTWIGCEKQKHSGDHD